MESRLEVILHAVLNFQPRPGAAAPPPGASWIVGVVPARLVLCLAWVGPENIPRLVARAGHTTLVLVGLISALGAFGVDGTAMVAGLGLTGFAWVFAFRDVLANAGVLVLPFRPFVNGERINVAGGDGCVDASDLRYTTLVKEDGRLLITNSVVFGEKVLVRTLPTL